MQARTLKAQFRHRASHCLTPIAGLPDNTPTEGVPNANLHCEHREARDANVILGQTHFIKSVEDIHEALVGAVPGVKFGLAFCEASGKCLVRRSGTDPAMIELAKKNARAIGAGHAFIVFLGEGFYPVNVLNALKMVPEVCRIFCATANPTEVVLAETEQGRGILGVVDGFPPKGVEDEGEIKWRKDFCGRSDTSCEPASCPHV